MVSVSRGCRVVCARRVPGGLQERRIDRTEKYVWERSGRKVGVCCKTRRCINKNWGPAVATA